MFKTNKTPVNYPGLEEEIARIISELSGLDPNSHEYAQTVEQLEKLDALTCHKVEKKALSKDALLAAGANLAGILLILNYERIGAVTSKALGFVRKV